MSLACGFTFLQISFLKTQPSKQSNTITSWADKTTTYLSKLKLSGWFEDTHRQPFYLEKVESEKFYVLRGESQVSGFHRSIQVLATGEQREKIVEDIIEDRPRKEASQKYSGCIHILMTKNTDVC